MIIMKKSNELKKDLKSTFSALVIPASIVAGILVYMYVLGSPKNFQGFNHDNAPLPGNYIGIVYKGGFIVPILMALMMIVITYSIERFITIRKAQGKSSVVQFVRRIKNLLLENKIEEAKAECDKQKGSVANVVQSALVKYQLMEQDDTISKDQKLVTIQKEVEECTALELPSLEQNLVILATISSVATLMGLLGTVLGMIRAFSALANAGAPDSVALASGISEALINTALGISTAALAIIAYNFFTTSVDKLTHSIDEAGFSLVQSYAVKHK